MEINFTEIEIDHLRMYGGYNGNKLGIIYDGDCYMLKFPPKPTRNLNMSYTNSCISEYVACHIFESLGIETQRTILGLYKDKMYLFSPHKNKKESLRRLFFLSNTNRSTTRCYGTVWHYEINL